MVGSKAARQGAHQRLRLLRRREAVVLHGGLLAVPHRARQGGLRRCSQRVPARRRGRSPHGALSLVARAAARHACQATSQACKTLAQSTLHAPCSLARARPPPKAYSATSVKPHSLVLAAKSI